MIRIYLAEKALSDFFDKLLQNCKIIGCSFILQFWSLRRVIEREREPWRFPFTLSFPPSYSTGSVFDSLNNKNAGESPCVFIIHNVFGHVTSFSNLLLQKNESVDRERQPWRFSFTGAFLRHLCPQTSFGIQNRLGKTRFLLWSVSNIKIRRQTEDAKLLIVPAANPTFDTSSRYRPWRTA